MRYIITQSQFHGLIYKYLDDIFSNKNFKKKINQDREDGNAWRIEMFSDEGKKLINYFWFGPGEYDDGSPHNGIGGLHINPKIIDTLRAMIPVRENKIMDIIADWVSENIDVDIDDISIYPPRESPPIY